MRVILDTNGFISGVFFSGLPERILEAWRDGKITWNRGKEEDFSFPAVDASGRTLALAGPRPYQPR